MNAPDFRLAASAVRTDREWLEPHWMPYCANRAFKADPHLFVAGEGAWLTTHDGRRLYDSLSGLWCTGLGHCRTEISAAIARQASTLDFSPAFQYGHPLSFELANRIVEHMPEGLNRVFFTNSGSEAADTSLKMARAYWRLKGQAGKTRLVGRIRGYHGVGFGGISVGGLVSNRKLFGQTLEADHLPHTQPPNGSFCRGMPEEGAHLADELLQLIALHDASNIAAVIVEPFAGSFMSAPGPNYVAEFTHGYTYSAHPIACAAGLAAIDLLEQDNAIERVQELAPYFEAAVHTLKGAKHVGDVRNFGLAAGITLLPAPGEPAKRPYQAAMAMYDKGFYLRNAGDCVALAPPFISTRAEIDSVVNALGEVLSTID